VHHINIDTNTWNKTFSVSCVEKKGIAKLYKKGIQIMQKIELKMILASNASKKSSDEAIAHAL
jgi:hypothetical protein